MSITKKLFLPLCVCYLFFCLSGCNEEYHINRNGIKEIVGVQQLYGSTNNISLNKDDVDVFVDNIEKLHLKRTFKESEVEGRDFFFTIYYEDGKEVNINLSEKETSIDRYIYRTSSYSKECFEYFFK